MSRALHPRLAAFLRNDVDYAPFGAGFLRGVTPARMALLGLICIASVPAIENIIANSGFNAQTFRLWWERAFIHFMICFPYMVLIVWIDRRTVGVSLKSRIGAFAAATLLGGLITAYWLTAWPAIFGATYRLWPMASLFYYKAVVAGAFCSAILIFFEREREAGRKLLGSRLARVAAERQIVEARLQLLRAQIEPHFLFNSLANVKVLYEQQPKGGRQLLRNLSGYLRRAVEKGKDKEATLADQVAMARGYLEILQERMGDRLRVRIDIPADLQLARVPTLMIGTLVENAVKHGIGPRDRGGLIEISARRDGDALLVQVADDGVGIRGESGTGIGLANSRARLESLYPKEAELDLATNPAGGVTATLRLPLRRAEAPAAGADSVIDTESVAVSSSPSTFLQRFVRALSWKRCAWALGIGLAYSLIAVLGTFASPYAMLGIASVYRSLEILLCVTLFLLAIVGVEAWSDLRPPRGWHYAIGWLCAALLIAGANWTFPDPLGQPDMRDEEARKNYSRYFQPGKVDLRTRELLATRVFIMDGALGILIYVWLRNARRASEALARAEIERTDAERKLVTSQVEAVEAEVDPGFVFSTLETIENTYDRDRAAADAMLDELIAFLRAAIPKVRGEREGETKAPETAPA